MSRKSSKLFGTCFEFDDTQENRTKLAPLKTKLLVGDV